MCIHCEQILISVPPMNVSFLSLRASRTNYYTGARFGPTRWNHLRKTLCRRIELTIPAADPSPSPLPARSRFLEREGESGGALLTLHAHGHPHLTHRANDIQQTSKKGTIATYGAAPERTPPPARKQAHPAPRSAERRNQEPNERKDKSSIIPPHGRVFQTFYFHLQLHSLSKNCPIYTKKTH